MSRALTGLILILLGSLCISRPGPILQFLSWVAGMVVLFSGFSRFISWFGCRMKGVSGGSVFSWLFQILLGLALIRCRALLGSTVGIVLIVTGVFYFLSLFGFMRVERYVHGHGFGRNRKNGRGDGQGFYGNASGSGSSSSGSSGVEPVEFKATSDSKSEWIDEQ